MSRSLPSRGPLPTTEPIVRPRVPPGIVVAIACVAQFMVILDTSIVNVALPAMKTALGLSATDQQWVVDGYLVTFGGFLLLAARAGDLLGRRRVFQTGLVVFIAASLAGGLAQDPGLLLAARMIQGVGAAALAPSSLSLITVIHPEGESRLRALAIWAAAGSAAGAVGLVLGGVLTSELSWRWVLFVNIPVGVALLVASGAALVCTVPGKGRARLDLAGAVTITLGIGLLVYGVSEATTAGWGSGRVVASLAAATASLVAFGGIESLQTSPLIPLGVLARPNLSASSAIMGVLGVCATATVFFVSLYLQQVLGYSAIKTGVAMVPMSIIMIIGAVISKRLVPPVGPRAVVIAGGVICAIGMAWLSRLPVHPAYAAHVLGPTLIGAGGASLMIFPVTSTATAGLEVRLAGLASGLLNVGRQLGGAVGLAVLVTIADTVTRQGHDGLAAATVDGYRVALLVSAGVSLVSTVLAAAMPKLAPRARNIDPLPPRRTVQPLGDSGVAIRTVQSQAAGTPRF